MFLGLKVSAGLQSARLFSALLFGRCVADRFLNVLWTH